MNSSLSERPEFKAFEEVCEAHRKLRARLATIEKALENRTVSIAEISDMLAQLADQLIKHFACEEEGGYFAEALIEAPQLVSHANRLMLQHPKMTAEARELAGVADADAFPDLWWKQTQEQFIAFKEELLRHEKKEDGLIQEAMNRDIGSND